MLILALDTTLAACSAAVYDSAAGRVLASLKEPMQQGHAERLASMTAAVASKAGVELHQIDRIAVTTGPGTFTGVRIGLAMALGMGRALGVPVTGISTLQAIAANVTGNDDGLPISVIMDARRQAVYVQSFSNDLQPLDEAQCIGLADLASSLSSEPRIVIGSGVGLVTPPPGGWQLSRAGTVPDAGGVGWLAKDVPADGPPPRPVYLRPADAKPQARLIKLAPVAVTITPANAAYADVLSHIHGECFAAGWSPNDLAEMLTSPGAQALIAVPEGSDDPAGFVLLRRAADEAEIITLCVRPTMRRRGIAAKLLDAAIKELAPAGIARLFLEVHADNVPAKALYGSSGFKEAGVRPGYYKLEDGSRADAVIMALELS